MEYVVEDNAKFTVEDDSVIDDGIEEKRESLAILASMGDTRKYTGETMSLGDVKKLTPNEVEKYFRRYHAVSSRDVLNTLVEGGIKCFPA